MLSSLRVRKSAPWASPYPAKRSCPNMIPARKGSHRTSFSCRRMRLTLASHTLGCGCRAGAGVALRRSGHSQPDTGTTARLTSLLVPGASRPQHDPAHHFQRSQERGRITTCRRLESPCGSAPRYGSRLSTRLAGSSFIQCNPGVTVLHPRRLHMPAVPQSSATVRERTRLGVVTVLEKLSWQPDRPH